MNYNPQTPIAVFLGPSLDKSQASQLLAANYYPPARMGDIYRILGSGVRIIVLIDGIFHHEASVWQRELLEALDNNITVIGASSMGALRAAELHHFGMVGHGTIFMWYRDGVIEGDDEVALNHADESNGFQPFSEPLVNIRYNLMQAVKQGCISQAQGTDLIEYAKSIYYADRSYPVLFNSPVVKKWPHQTQDRLLQFINQKSINLKKQDAISAIRYGATVAKRKKRRMPPSLSVMNQNRYYNLVRYRKKGFLHWDGHLVSGEALLAKVLQEGELVKTLRPELIKNYFLLLWAKQKNIKCPVNYAANYTQTWKNSYIKSNFDQWLRANGLTEREFQTELYERALLRWMIDQDPNFFGLDFEPYHQFVEVLLSLNAAAENGTVKPEQDKDKWLRQAVEICYLAAWAGENGITCPLTRVETFIKKWEETGQIHDRTTWLDTANLTEECYLSLLANWSCCNWLIEKEPTYFGYASWSFEVALLKELQITGRAAHFVKNLAKEIR